jgi:hypothetical protein
MDNNTNPANEIRINVADVRKTFNTIGEVRWMVVFQASEGNWTIARFQGYYKTEKAAQKKLAGFLAKFAK